MGGNLAIAQPSVELLSPGGGVYHLRGDGGKAIVSGVARAQDANQMGEDFDGFTR